MLTCAITINNTQYNTPLPWVSSSLGPPSSDAGDANASPTFCTTTLLPSSPAHSRQVLFLEKNQVLALKECFKMELLGCGHPALPPMGCSGALWVTWLRAPSSTCGLVPSGAYLET